MLGIQADQLQEGISIDGQNKVTGTSKYLASYPKFSKSAKGNFLALKIEEATKGETVTGKITGTGATGKTVTLDEDGIIIFKVSNNDNKITITNEETSKVFDLTGLTLSPAE